jgi:hypothetical protein
MREFQFLAWTYARPPTLSARVSFRSFVTHVQSRLLNVLDHRGCLTSVHIDIFPSRRCVQVWMRTKHGGRPYQSERDTLDSSFCLIID